MGNPPDGTTAKVNSNGSALANAKTTGSEKYPRKTYIEIRLMMLAKGNMGTETYSGQSTSRRNQKKLA